MSKWKLMFMVFLILSIGSSAIASDQMKFSQEEKKEMRFFKKFDRHYYEFADEIYDDMNYYSDEELNQIYLDMITWLDQHGNYQEADAMMSIHEKSSGNARTQLRYMISEKAHDQAVSHLKQEIKNAGGFEAYQTKMKAMKKENLDVACRIEKIAASTVILPVALFGGLAGMGVISALYYGIFTPVVGAWILTTVGINGFVNPFLLNHITVGCYKERDTVNTKKLYIKNGSFKANCSGKNENFNTEIKIQDTTEGTKAILSIGSLVNESVLLKPRLLKNQFQNAKKDKLNLSRIILRTDNHESLIFESAKSFYYQDKTLTNGVTCNIN